MERRPEMRLGVIFKPDLEDGGWIASCPTLPGCHGQGETREKALADLRRAVQAMVEYLREQGEALPSDEEAGVLEVTA